MPCWALQAAPMASPPPRSQRSPSKNLTDGRVVYSRDPIGRQIARNTAVARRSQGGRRTRPRRWAIAERVPAGVPFLVTTAVSAFHRSGVIGEPPWFQCEPQAEHLSATRTADSKLVPPWPDSRSSTVLRARLARSATSCWVRSRWWRRSRSASASAAAGPAGSRRRRGPPRNGFNVPPKSVNDYIERIPRAWRGWQF